MCSCFDSGGGGGGSTETETATATDTATPTATATATDTATSTPTNDSPTANISKSYDNYITDEAIHLSASNSSDPDGSISSYRWELGDGTTKYGKSITHQYSSSGSYSIELRVSDGDGGYDYTTTSVFVGAGFVTEFIFEDGHKLKERVVVVAPDEMIVRSGGKKYSHSLTQSVKEDMDNAWDTLQSYGMTPPAANSEKETVVSIGAAGNSTTVTNEYINRGEGDTEELFPLAVGPPADWQDGAFANWRSGGIVEAATSATGFGSGTAISEAFSEVRVDGSGSSTATIDYSGQFEAYLRGGLGTAGFSITLFVRDTETNDEVTKTIRSPARRPRTISPDDNTNFTLGFQQYDGGFSDVGNPEISIDSGENVESFDSGKVYQIGVRLRSTASAFEKEVLPAMATSVCLDGSRSNDDGPDEWEHPIGYDWWLESRWGDNDTYAQLERFDRLWG